MPVAIGMDFKTEPYFHQLVEFEKYADHEFRALLWQMRSGKSKAMIDMACYLFSEKKIDSVVIVAPNGVHINWIEREIPTHHWDSVPRIEKVWVSSILSSAKKTEKVQKLRKIWWDSIPSTLENKQELVWWSFNSESLIHPNVRKLLKRVTETRRVFIIYDESHDFRTPGSIRSKMAHALSKRCLYRRILTGTLVNNSPLHSWSQFELLVPKALNFQRYGEFRKQYSYTVEYGERYTPSYKSIVKYINIDDLKKDIINLSSIILKKDLCDMPELSEKTVHIKFNSNQVRIYKELHSQFCIEIAKGEKATIGNNTSKLMKLQQVGSGFLIDSYKKVHTIPGINYRLNAVSEEVRLCSRKVIVWCRFREDIDKVVKRLQYDGHKVAQYHGRVSLVNKAIVRKLFDFNAENDTKVLVGYPTVGINLSAASKIIWYSHVFDNILRSQASERATMVGGASINVVNLVSNGVDQHILKSIREKISVANKITSNDMGAMAI